MDWYVFGAYAIASAVVVALAVVNLMKTGKPVTVEKLWSAIQQAVSDAERLFTAPRMGIIKKAAVEATVTAMFPSVDVTRLNDNIELAVKNLKDEC